MSLLHFYRRPALPAVKKDEVLTAVRQRVSSEIRDIQTEYCFNIETTSPLSTAEVRMLRWLLSETFEPENFSHTSFLSDAAYGESTPSPPPAGQTSEAGEDRTEGFILEVGPRMNFTTAWSTNAVSVCNACGLGKITRIERSRRYKFMYGQPSTVSRQRSEAFASMLISDHWQLFYDRMTECPYAEPLRSFSLQVSPEPVYSIPLMEEGKRALQEINRTMGLGLDEWDIRYYHDLFVHEIGRDPTNVECFDLSQSNSEHSRHWFFKGRLIISGGEAPLSLLELIRRPLSANPNNSVIAFRDNSSSIKGYTVESITPDTPGTLCRYRSSRQTYDIIFTAETHNFPSGVAPFPGAETGTGGRIRDVEATGRGGLVIAGTAAYCVGNLLIPDYEMPWENRSFHYPDNLASALEIEIQASNGASDYGNKFGEPVIQGFTRSFGMRLPDGERYEWIKPIMFTGGIGQMDARHREKGQPEEGMLVMKIGGPAYRIGIGGGAASSMIQGENIAELDFNAVQRGDAEMEQKMNRVLRSCIEMGDANPIISIHDQGAGGNCNVVKEIIYPAGARIEVRNIPVGDSTLSVLEIWGAEYQEQNALLLRPEHLDLFHEMCRREKVPCAAIGRITGDGLIVLYDGIDGSTPVNLDLKKILGEMPRKTFQLQRLPLRKEPIALPEGITVREALERVLRLLSAGSKRFLTNKVDRSVTGLVARQQCCGALQLTVSDVAVISQSHFGTTGAAISIGERPVLTLLDPRAMARISVGEALTNMVWAKISGLNDIKCSGNWMWAAKLSGEGAKLYDAAVALSDVLTDLGIAIDGGKDSLSMAAMVRGAGGKTEVVKSPGTLVISAYATCPDITKVITPDIKRAGLSRLMFVHLGSGKNPLGGSSLAQVYDQTGGEPPDLEDAGLLQRAFFAVQGLIDRGLVLSGHDRSDGGLVTTLLEMAFSGNCGIEIELQGVTETDVVPTLFSEELGLVIECLPEKEDEIRAVCKDHSVPCQTIGRTVADKRIIIDLLTRHDSRVRVLDEDMRILRGIWEETGYRIERLQSNPLCAEEERKNNFDRTGPNYILTFDPESPPLSPFVNGGPSGNPGLKKGGNGRSGSGPQTSPKVAIIREEGSNSDREMASAFYMAGFEPWDVAMTDFLEGRIRLSDFRGAAFVGGFSYADVLDSAKGWAGVIRFHPRVWEELQNFYRRDDTFSLGVCNGCQLMALIGWVPWQGIPDEQQPRFIRNSSGRFESRFSTVRILKSPSVFLNGMEGSVLGIWVAHGEGRAYFPDKTILEKVKKADLAPLRYADDAGSVTTKYPFNPNGSEEGIAGLCSPDGRHLAVMPHPERTFLGWQWAWMPEAWKKNLISSPWLNLFRNARQWCG